MKTLSVIVPCYNVEEYIEKCIKSLVDSKVPGMEIILVNDGSKDNTLAIINKYKKKYPKLINVIDQKNKGISMARNAGIDIALGKYITFVDSDDYIEPNMYKVMMKKMNDGNFDIVTCGVNIIYPTYTKKISSGINNDCMNKDDVKKIMNSWYFVVWNKIYKKELFRNLVFKKNVWYEDVELLYKLIPRINSIGVVEDNLYNYIQRQNSVTYTYNKKLYNLIENLDDIVKYYKDNDYYHDYEQELEYAYVRYSFATFIKRLSKSKNKQEFKKGVKYVLTKVKETFPQYKKNVYLKGNSKGFYLKHFNKVVADMVYFYEKNKMN